MEESANGAMTVRVHADVPYDEQQASAQQLCGQLDFDLPLGKCDNKDLGNHCAGNRCRAL
jgi:hypothetical protein